MNGEKTSKEKLERWNAMKDHGDVKALSDITGRTVQTIVNTFNNGTKYKAVESAIDKYFEDKNK